MSSRFLLPILALAVYFVGATEYMLSPMLTPLAVAFKTNPAHASWLVSSYALSYVLAAPIFGYTADRIDRRQLLLASLVFFALDGIAITLAPSFAFAIGFRILGGCASAALIPTTFALIADLVPQDRQAGAMGAVMLGMTFGISAGPVFAGFLTKTIDWRAPFLMNAGGCLITFLIGRQTLPQKTTRNENNGTLTFSWLRRIGIVRPLIAKGAWNGTSVATFLLSGEVLRQHYGLGTVGVGAAVSAFGLGLGFGEIVVGYVSRACKRDEVTLMVATGLIAVAMTTFMTAPLFLPGALVFLALWGAALGLAAPSSTAILARRAHGDKGQVLAISESLNNLAVMMLLPIATASFEAHGAGSAMCVAGAGVALGVGLTAIDLRTDQL